MSDPTRRQRGRLRFTLRQLLVITLLFSIGMSWFSVAMRRASDQREARAALERLAGAHYHWDYQFDELGNLHAAATPPSPAWARNLLGEDFFHNVVSCFLFGVDDRITDRELVHLNGFPRLRTLDIRGTNTTDAGLAHLRQLDGLDAIWLESDFVTDAGLVHVGSITSLTHLGISDTRVTDAGLKHLGELRNLRALSLLRTNVTAQGAARLRNALPDLQFVEVGGETEGGERL